MDGPAMHCEPVTISASLGSKNSWPGQPRNSTSSLCCFRGACSSAAAPVHLQERRIRADEEDEEAIAVAAEQAVLTRCERERERARDNCEARHFRTRGNHLGIGGRGAWATLLFGFAVAADGTLAAFGLGPAAPTSGLCAGQHMVKCSSFQLRQTVDCRTEAAAGRGRMKSALAGGLIRGAGGRSLTASVMCGNQAGTNEI